MLEYSAIIALICVFIHSTFTKGNIFEKVGVFIKKIVGEYWCKPLICCLPCMTFYWGALVYYIGSIFGVFETLPLADVIFILLCAAGINVVLSYFVEAEKAEIKELKK